MTFTLTSAEFDKLEAQLADSHQVLISFNVDSGSIITGSITTLDQKIAASFNFTAEKNLLDVQLTKHDGYPGFIANAGLKSKLNGAIEAIRKG